MKQRRAILILALSLSLSIWIIVSVKSFSGLKQLIHRKVLLEKEKSAWMILEQEIKVQIDGFPADAGIIIKDLSRDWEISFDKEKLFAAASVVKVPIMAACFFALSEGQLDLEQRIILKAGDKVLGSGKLKRLPSGKEFKVGELIEFMIAESDNTATNLLIDTIGFDYLNDIFIKLGLKHTNISRKMMDFKSRRQGKENYTNCLDLANLLEMIYEGRLIDRKTSAYCLQLLKKQKIKDRIPKQLPEEVIVAHKTGLERGICHDIGILFPENGRDFLICVLTSHAEKTASRAKAFISEVALLAYNYFKGLQGYF